MHFPPGNNVSLIGEDVAFYGVSLNNTTFLHAIGYSTGANLYQDFYNSSVGNMIIVCAGAIPGFCMTVALVDRLGRKPIQLIGFTMVLITMCIMGFGYHALGDIGLMACYVVAQFFFNFGPNATTFIIPGEVFPTRYRSTSYGISAAAGKIGAIVAQCVIAPLKSRGATPSDSSPWLDHVIEIFALFMLFGVFTTLLLPETKRKTLEELAQEEPTGRPHLNDNESLITGQGSIELLVAPRSAVKPARVAQRPNHDEVPDIDPKTAEYWKAKWAERWD